MVLVLAAVSRQHGSDHHDGFGKVLIGTRGPRNAPGSSEALHRRSRGGLWPFQHPSHHAA